MSWGATAFTPIITYNTPPFGFHERTQSSDFSTCPENPWSGSENLKEAINEIFSRKNRNDSKSRLLEGFETTDYTNNKYFIYILLGLGLLLLL